MTTKAAAPPRVRLDLDASTGKFFSEAKKTE
jgi:hypothetical protein